MQSVKPVLRYRTPRYPDAEKVLLHPELLRVLPKRFYAKPAVTTALSMLFALGLAGCVPRSTEDSPVLSPASGTTPAPTEQVTASPSVSTGGSVFLPLFEHGEGYGAYGCVSVAPPVFLSEEEAADAIRAEAANYGIAFSEEKTLENVTIPSILEGEEITVSPKSGSLELDGYDRQYNLGFEFVSTEDLSSWKERGENALSVSFYPAKEAAEVLAQSIPRTAVFYDPMDNDYDSFHYEWPDYGDEEPSEEQQAEDQQKYEAYLAEYEAAQREKSLEELREQVRDLFDWLKAQGVI